MEQRFVKVKLKTEQGYREGCIDVHKVIAFHESPYDRKVTKVYMRDEIFHIEMTCKGFCELIGVS